MQVSRKDIEKCQTIIANFRVNELHLFLQYFKHPKLGRKEELVSRAQSILTSGKYQVAAVQKVLEVQASAMSAQQQQPPTGFNNNPQYGGGNNAYQQQQQSAMNRARMGYTGFMGAPSGGMAPPQSISNSYGHGYAATVAAAAPQRMSFSTFTQQQPPQIPNVLLAAYGHPTTGPIHSGQARNVRMIELPFYDQKTVILPMTEMPAFGPSGPKPGEARVTQHFNIPANYHPDLSYRSEDKPMPRYELQLRMFLLDTSAVQTDAFPPNCFVKIDEYNVQLPSIIPTNKPNAEQKRLSRPVNLTHCIQPLRKERPHRITVEWSGDKRAWAFGIFLVVHVNSTILQERIMKNAGAKREFKTTKRMIVDKLNGAAEDDVVMDTLKTSLNCPLMRTRIRIPARAVGCTHLQTFDLTNYLMMCEKRPEWKCPVCSGDAIFSKLLIDEYFQTLVNDVAEGVDDVELLKNGTWRNVEAEPLAELSDDDADADAKGDDVVVASSSSAKPPRRTTPSTSKSVEAPSGGGMSTEARVTPVAAADDSIIVLSDSDDEGTMNGGGERQASPGPATLTPAGSSGLRPSHSYSSSSSSSSSSISSSRCSRSPQAPAPTERHRLTVETQNSNSSAAAEQQHSSSGETDDSIIVLDDDGVHEVSGGVGSAAPISNNRASTSSNASTALVDDARQQQHHALAAQLRTSQQQAPQPSPSIGNQASQRAQPAAQNGTATGAQQHHRVSVFGAHNGVPALQTNGYHPPLFHPVIEDAAKNQVGEVLATFLMNVYARNNLNPQRQQPQNGRSNGM